MSKKHLSLDQFDLGTKSNEGVDIELKNPVNGQGLGIFITVVGRYSERYQAAVREVSNQSIKVAANKKEKIDIVTEANERGTQLLARSTLGWRTEADPVIFFHGKDQGPSGHRFWASASYSMSQAVICSCHLCCDKASSSRGSIRTGVS
jgi:hypothetical protein